MISWILCRIFGLHDVDRHTVKGVWHVTCKRPGCDW